MVSPNEKGSAQAWDETCALWPLYEWPKEKKKKGSRGEINLKRLNCWSYQIIKGDEIKINLTNLYYSYSCM